MATTSSRAEAAGCGHVGTYMVGSWRYASASWGNKVSYEAIEDAEGRFTVNPDGSSFGTTGCRGFSGTAEFEYDWLTNVEIDVTGEPCADDTAHRRGTAMIDTLLSGPHLVVGDGGMSIFGGEYEAINIVSYVVD